VGVLLHWYNIIDVGGDILKLTSRDFEFLQDLYLVRYLNSKRIAKLFGNYKSAMRRLKQLQEGKYIKIIDYFLNGEHVYTITKRGCGIIDVEYISNNKTNKLLHALAVSDAYFYLKSMNNIKEFKLEHVYKFKYNSKKYIYRPDAIVNIDRCYFVEVELSNKRLDRRVRTWEALYLNGMFAQYPPIIIISNNIVKVQSIIDKCKKENLIYIFKDYNEIKDWIYFY